METGENKVDKPDRERIGNDKNNLRFGMRRKEIYVIRCYRKRTENDDIRNSTIDIIR